MSDKIKLSFIQISNEKEHRNQIKKMVSEMVCDYLKSIRKRTPNPAHSKQIQQVLQETRKMLDIDEQMIDIY